MSIALIIVPGHARESVFRPVLNKKLYRLKPVNGPYCNHHAGINILAHKTRVYVDWEFISGQSLEDKLEAEDDPIILTKFEDADPIDIIVKDLSSSLKTYARTFNVQVCFYKNNKQLTDVTQDFIQWLDQQPSIEGLKTDVSSLGTNAQGRSS